MLQTYSNSLELKQIYDYNNNPTNSLEYAKNLGYKLGLSTHNNDHFNPYLETLINQNILTKIYDFTEGNFREGLYEFEDGAQISFFGTNTMDLKLYYEFND